MQSLGRICLRFGFLGFNVRGQFYECDAPATI